MNIPSTNSTDINSGQTFHDASRNAARRFLQTVVVIDDQARFSPTSPKQEVEETLKQIRELGAEEKDEKAPEIDDFIPEDIVGLTPFDDTETAITSVAQDLDAQSLISHFAKEGLVCAVLKPESGNLDDVFGNAISAAHRADVVIIDWQILEKPAEEGNYALGLIEKIIHEDEKSGGRLRLFVIYTGETSVNEIAQKIQTEINQRLNKNIILDAGKPVLSENSLRIVVLAKDSSKALPENKVSIDKLPERILEEFTYITQGLVTNTTVCALGVLRDETHSLLKKLHRGLDAPFLTHRTLIEHPSDAGTLLVSLISDELQSIMEQHGVSHQVKFEMIKQWLEMSYPDLGDSSGQNSVPPESSLRKLLEIGTKAYETEGGELKNVGLTKANVYKKLTQILSRDREKKAAEQHNEEFAMLTTLRSMHIKEYQKDEAPILTLGVILNKVNDVEVDGADTEGPEKVSYWLCLRQTCDSIRLPDGPVKFPLFPLVEVGGGNTQFDIVVPVSDSFSNVRLSTKFKLSDCDNVEFSANGGCVRGNSLEGHVHFESTKGTYYMVAQLKLINAQSILNNLSADMARVGTEVSEWLRLSNR